VTPAKAAASCAGCFAWGVLPGRYCRACFRARPGRPGPTVAALLAATTGSRGESAKQQRATSFRQLHRIGRCAGCDREQALKKQYCRLCWAQASLEAKGQVTVLAPALRTIGHHQLFFAGMHRIRQPGVRIGKQGRQVCAPARRRRWR
jgi:hypothetical protein